MKTASQLIWFATLLLAVGNPALVRGGDRVLTNAEEILNLPIATAGQGLNVRLSAVVVDRALPRNYALIVADKTAGIYVHTSNNGLAEFQRFDLLEITGFTTPGEFAPCVVVTSARKVGTSELPKPYPTTYGKLITGALDAQLIEVAGVVRRVWQGDEPGIWHIRLAMEGGIVPVRLTTERDPRIQVDSEVRLHAICLYQFNPKRQVLSPVLQVSPGMLLDLEKPAPENPFVGPARPLSSVLQYSRTNALNHRIHLRGIVTRAQTGSFVWLRDETSGLRIHSLQEGDLEPGDELDVVGFQNCGSYPPVLEDAIFRRIGRSEPPKPISLAKVADAYQHEDDLVSLEGRLVGVRPISDGLSLSFERQDGPFSAIVKPLNGAEAGADWPLQSLIRVTGICSLQYEEPSPMLGLRHAQTFNILVTAPSDLSVLQTPPFWNARLITSALGAVAATSLLVAGTVAFLARRRLKEQQLRRAMAEKEFTAILSERNRLAREIHDTLAQGLTATLVQLRLLKKQVNGSSAEAVETLNSAQLLIRGSLDEARASIWNMRSHALETGDLPSALENVLQQILRGASVRPTFEVSGTPRRLAPVIENNLLRIGQEAITNALKHADPQHVRVKLQFGERRLILEISDDGKGIQTYASRMKGFGMISMKERAAELKAEFKVHTTPTQGTTIQLDVPLLPS